MTRILGVSGSLREKSFNTALLRAATSLAGKEVELEIATLRGIPLYDGDREQSDGIPAPVTELKERIRNSDGLLISTPEYNNSMPGVLKNAIDWLSRPASEIPEIFGDRAVAIIGASPGGFGTILAQNAWLPVMRMLGTRQWFGGRLMVSRAGNVFGDDGSLQDEDVRKRLSAFVRDFAKFADRSA